MGAILQRCDCHCVSGVCVCVCVCVCVLYSETSLIRHSMGPDNNVGLGGCWIMECLLPYLCMATVPHIMVGLERMLDYRGVGLVRFHCITYTYLYHQVHGGCSRP